jgi:hypothetical protein
MGWPSSSSRISLSNQEISTACLQNDLSRKQPT